MSTFLKYKCSKNMDNWIKRFFKSDIARLAYCNILFSTGICIFITLIMFVVKKYNPFVAGFFGFITFSIPTFLILPTLIGRMFAEYRNRYSYRGVEFDKRYESIKLINTFLILIIFLILIVVGVNNSKHRYNPVEDEYEQYNYGK